MGVIVLKQITVRGIPEEIKRIIMKEAKEKGMSLNKVLISLLERGVGGRKKKGEGLYHDLDHLCGLWNEEDEERFEEALKMQRRIEDSLWKGTG